MTRLEQAQQALEDAQIQVSRAAQDVSDSAEYNSIRQSYTIAKEDMDELKAAIKLWKEASNKFLEATIEAANEN